MKKIAILAMNLMLFWGCEKKSDDANTVEVVNYTSEFTLDANELRETIPYEPTTISYQADDYSFEIQLQEFANFTDEELVNFAAAVSLSQISTYNDPNERKVIYSIIKRLVPNRYIKTIKLNGD